MLNELVIKFKKHYNGRNEGIWRDGASFTLELEDDEHRFDLAREDLLRLANLIKEVLRTQINASMVRANGRKLSFYPSAQSPGVLILQGTTEYTLGHTASDAQALLECLMYAYDGTFSGLVNKKPKNNILPENPPEYLPGLSQLGGRMHRIPGSSTYTDGLGSYYRPIP